MLQTVRVGYSATLQGHFPPVRTHISPMFFLVGVKEHIADDDAFSEHFNTEKELCDADIGSSSGLEMDQEGDEARDGHLTGTVTEQ